jgi:hypothetical protein
LGLPFPCARQKGFAPKVFLFQALFGHRFYYTHFCRYAGMVCAGQPERGITLHTLCAYYRILYRIIQRVPHMELACDIWRRYDYGERLFCFVDFRPEPSFVQPVAVYPFLGDSGRLFLAGLGI